MNHRLVLVSMGMALCAATSALEQQSLSDVPADALAYLNKTPEKKITLPLVLQRAMETSSSFKSIEASAYSIEAARLQGRAPLDWRLTSKASQLWNRNQPQSPFMPLTDNQTLAVGANTLFSSGTLASVELSQGKTTLTYKIPAGSPLSIPNLKFSESKATLQLTQSLWKDSLGYGTRRAREAGEKSSEAQKAAFQESVEDWTLGMMQVFYGAWLAQAQAKAAATNVERRERLLKVMHIKARRGTAERPDVLQVESSLKMAQAQQAQANQVIADRWRQLVVTLQFPLEWLKIDPKIIPMGLDDPTHVATNICKAGTPDPAQLSTIRKLRSQSEATQLQLERARNAVSPALDLVGYVTYNGIDQKSGKAFSAMVSGDHPQSYIGLSFSLPLERSAEEAAARNAYSDSLHLRALKSAAEENFPSDWMNACTNLDRLIDQLKSQNEVLENQLQRAQLEHERFEIGKVQTQAVIQAEDDATNARLARDATEADLRMAAWKVRRLSGNLKEQLDKYRPEETL